MTVSEPSKRAAFKKRRRQWEFELIVQSIREVLPQNIRRHRILEFGCGPAGGAELLSRLGDLVESDVYQDPRMNLPPGVPFVLCSICRTPFAEKRFNLLVSNQVIEHVADLPAAFAEMKRIADKNALFVFSVPTATLMVLSVPGQIWKKVENVGGRILRLFGRQKAKGREATEAILSTPASKSVKQRFWLGGHGCYPGFLEAFRVFRVRQWRRLLEEHGFAILRAAPLLCYGSSHCRVIPTNRVLAKVGISSSYLFIARDGKAAE